MNCQDECLSSAKRITGGKREKEFTLEKVIEDFKNRGLTNAPATIRQNLLWMCYGDILERPYPYKTITYRLGLMGLDEERARRELGKRIEEINKKLKELEKSSKS